MKFVLLICLCFGFSLAVPVEGPGKKVNDLPIMDPYQPEKPPNVPIQLGERRKKTC